MAAGPPAGQKERLAPVLPWITLAVVTVSALYAGVVRVAADCLWLVALGDHMRENGLVRHGLPFAAAPADGWPNVPALSELVMSLFHDLGPWGLGLLQVMAVAAALGLLARAARDEGAAVAATAGALLLVALGALPAFGLVRLQVFSLALFPVLLLLLRAEHRRPTRAIWLLPFLVALWTNLHGAVLLGVAVAGAYLLFARLRVRPLETLLVGPATLLALLVTPLGPETVDYYLGVMHNEAAAQGAGLWATPSWQQPFDVITGLALVPLLFFALRRRLAVWEYVALVGLLASSALASRNSVWLLMLVAAPAAVGMTRAGRAVRDQHRGQAVVTGAIGAVLVIGLLISRGDAVQSEDPQDVARAAELVGDRVTLASEPLAESLAVAGVTVLMADPIDAFSSEDQLAYLDFLEQGEPGTLLERVDAVVLLRGSELADVVDDAPGFRSSVAGSLVIYLRSDG